MAPSRNALSVSILVAVVVAAASVEAATADAPCDSVCRLKVATDAFAAAPPAKKAAAVKILGNKTEAEDAESFNKAAALAMRCLDGCSDKQKQFCAAGKKYLRCNAAMCEPMCSFEVQGQSFVADMYTGRSTSEKTAAIKAIDKQLAIAKPGHNIDTLIASCTRMCVKSCNEAEKDPACANCDDDCNEEIVAMAFLAFTPDQKEAIKKDIQAAAAPK